MRKNLKIQTDKENKKVNEKKMTLKELEVGKSAVICSVGGKGALRQHFLDMGMIPGAEVTVVKLAPMGDPMELQIHGYELTLRLAEADQIEIEQIARRSRAHEGMEMLHDCEHPGLGEEGKYHSKKDENPLPDGTLLTYALVGNQNWSSLLQTHCRTKSAASRLLPAW